MGHIPGSQLIPAGEIHESRQRAAARQDDRDLLFLNRRNIRPPVRWSHSKQKGIENAAALLGGFQAWQQKENRSQKK